MIKIHAVSNIIKRKAKEVSQRVSRVVMAGYSRIFYFLIPAVKSFPVVTPGKPSRNLRPGALGDPPGPPRSHFRNCKLFTYRDTI